MPKSFLENREIVHQLDDFAAWTLLPKKWGQNEKKKSWKNAARRKLFSLKLIDENFMLPYKIYLKFIYSEKATKFWKIFT